MSSLPDRSFRNPSAAESALDFEAWTDDLDDGCRIAWLCLDLVIARGIMANITAMEEEGEEDDE